MPDQQFLSGQAADVIIESLAGRVIDSLPIAICVFDLAGTLLGFNGPWLEIMRAHFPEVPAGDYAPGVKIFDVLPPNQLRVRRQRAEENGGWLREEGVPFEHDGAVSYFDTVFAPVIRDGETIGLVEILADATERVEAYRTLEQRVAERTAELERRREVAEGLHEIMTKLNSCCPQDEVLDCVIEQAKRLLGTETVAVYNLQHAGKAIMTAGSHGMDDDLIANIAFPTDEGFVASTLMQGKPLIFTDSSVVHTPIAARMAPEHRERLFQMFARYPAMLTVPLMIGGDVFGALAMYYPEPRVFPDEQIRLASELADHLSLALENSALRRESEENAAEAERSRLARDLHDAVTQTLFSASLIAEVLPRIWEQNRGEGRRRLEELRRLTRGALAEMRTLLVELRPTALVEADLRELLGQLIESSMGTNGIAATLAADGCPKLPSDVQVVFYRIAQEALNNIAKHSGAGNVEVMLACGADGSVRLAVSDDGRGFDGSEASGEHLGMRIMRERAASIDARLQVNSEQGRGTSVEVEWRPGKVA